MRRKVAISFLVLVVGCGGQVAEEAACREPSGDASAAPVAACRSGAAPREATRISSGRFVGHTVADGNAVYFFDGSDLKRHSLACGDDAIVATGFVNPRGLAVDSKNVYWADIESHTVRYAPIGGGEVVTLASNQRGGASRILLTSTDVYWLTLGQTPSDAGGAIMTVPIAGGEPRTLHSTPDVVEDIAIDGETIYWDENESPGVLKKMPLRGGPITTLTAVQSEVGMVVKGSFLYWLDNNATSVMRIGVDGGPATVFATTRPSPQRFAWDETSLYWGDGEGNITRASLTGDCVETLTKGQGSFVDIAVGTHDVFFASTSRGLFSVPK